MREEFIEIVISLMNFCRKYNKDYANIYFLDDHGSGYVDTEDKDYHKLDVFIGIDEAIEKIQNDTKKELTTDTNEN